MRRATGEFSAIFAAVLLALPLGGCVRRQTGTPPARPVPVAETDSAPQRSSLARILNFRDSGPPQASWDGQSSALGIKAPVDAAFTHCIEELRALNFTLRTDETRRTGASARITATKSDGTLVQIQMDERVAGTTEIRVKVGVTGDRTGSERILDDLQTSFKKSARQAPNAASQPALPTPDKR